MKLELGHTLPGYAYLPEAREAEKTLKAIQDEYSEAVDRKQAIILARRKEQAQPINDEVERCLDTLKNAVAKRQKFGLKTQDMLGGIGLPGLSNWGAIQLELDQVTRIFSEAKDGEV